MGTDSLAYVKAPIAVGGLGGSGTRVVARILIELGVGMGYDLNESLDNLSFTFLFARPELLHADATEFNRLLSIFVSAMTGAGCLSAVDTHMLRTIAAASRFQHSSAWLRERADALMLGAPTGPPTCPWGWKEPNTHVFVGRLRLAMPAMRYIHVIRSGLDAAYSSNQTQLLRWGPYLLGPNVDLSPYYALKYWCTVHRRVLDLCKPMAARFMLLNYDRLCQEPRIELERLTEFLGIACTDQQIQQLAALVRPPATIGRYRQHGLDDFDTEDVRFVAALGFDTDLGPSAIPLVRRLQDNSAAEPRQPVCRDDTSASAHPLEALAQAHQARDPWLAYSDISDLSLESDDLATITQAPAGVESGDERPGHSNSQAPAAILILGMHRSGTSALTRVINLLGADLPSRLMPGADDDNPRGFWESLPIYQLNDEMLAAVGSSWDDWRSVSLDALDANLTAEFKARALDLLHRDFTSSSLFVLKDPRISRLLPFWIDVLTELGAAPKCVLAIRNPLEIAASLRVRNGFSPAKSHLVWLRYVLDSERDTRFLPRAFVRYDALLNDWRGVAEALAQTLAIQWPITPGASARQIEDFLEPSLRHASVEDVDLLHDESVIQLVKDAYHELLALYREPSSRAPTLGLDAIERDLALAASIIGPALHGEASRAVDLWARARTMEVEIGNLKETVTEQANRLAAQEAHHQELARVIKITRAERDAARTAWRAGQRKVDQLKTNLRHTKEQVREKRAALKRKDARLNALYHSTSWKLTRPVRGVSRLAQRTRLALSLNPGRKSDAATDTGAQGQGHAELEASSSAQCKDARDVTLANETPAPALANLRIAGGVAAAPQVSVIIPVHNQILYTLACLDSIAKTEPDTSMEVLVIDDCSADDTNAQLSSRDDIRYIRSDTHLGFVDSCNIGAEKARGQFLFFLNNDTVVLEGWLDALVGTFSQEANVGLVGSKLIYPDGLLQEAGGIVWEDASGWNWGRLRDPAAPEYNFLRDVDYCSGAALMIRRSLFDAIGGFDKRYAPGYYEDTDLAFSVRQRGWRVLYQPLSQVVHYEGVTSGTDLSSGMKAYQVRNRQRFLEKWQPVLLEHGTSESRPPRLSADRAPAGRMLVVDHCTPTPDQDSGSIDMFNYLRMLTDTGYRVTFVPYSNFSHSDGYTAALQRMGVECVYRPYVDSLENLIEKRGEEFDAVMLSRAETAYACIDSIRAACCRAKIIFNTVDLHFLRERRRAELETGNPRSSKAIELEHKERYVMDRADITIVISSSELELLAREAPYVPVRVIPLLRDIPGRSVEYHERDGIVFVGGFRHPPNVDGLLWFCTDIWPQIRGRLPDVELTVVGSHPPAEVQALSALDGVRVVGFVEDLGPVFARARVSVAPLRYGAGQKGKVVTSLGYGVPCIVTGIAAEGLGLDNGQGIMIADEVADFAEAVTEIYKDPMLWEKISTDGLASATAQFSVDANRNRLAAILRELKLPH